MTYSYDPSQIMNGGKDQMRFELGDVLVDGGADTAFLSDQEIEAVLAHVSRWQKARLKLIEGVCRKLSFEVDFKDDGTSYALNQRAQRWIDMLKDERSGIASHMPLCGAVTESVNGSPDKGHYFYNGMLGNPNADGGGSK